MPKFLVEVRTGGTVEIDAADEESAIEMAIDCMIDNAEWDTYVEEIEE